MLALTEDGKVIKDSGCLTGEKIVACVMGKKDISDAYGHKESGLVDGKIKKVLPRMDFADDDQILNDQILMRWIKYGKWTEKKVIGVDKKNPDVKISSEQKLKIAEMALKYCSEFHQNFSELYKEIEENVCQ